MPAAAPASTRFVPAATLSLRPSNRMSGMRDLTGLRERAAARRDVLLEQRPEVPDQALDRLGGSARERAERVGADEGVELVDHVDVGLGGAAGLEPLQQLDTVGQPVAARRA